MVHREKKGLPSLQLCSRGYGKLAYLFHLFSFDSFFYVEKIPTMQMNVLK